MHFLEGLRGRAAAAVLLFHVFVEGFPVSTAVAGTLRHIFMFNDVLAVWVLFVASGFSLAIAYCRRRDGQTLATIALGRYVRLALPILRAVAFLYLLFCSRNGRQAREQRLRLRSVGRCRPPGPSDLLGLRGRTHLGRITCFRVVSSACSRAVVARDKAVHRRSLRCESAAERSRPTSCALLRRSLAPDAERDFQSPMSALLSGRISQFLGRISFPLYLIHGPLMLSYGNIAYRWIAAPTDFQKLMLDLSIVAVCIDSATLLAPLDWLGIVAAKRFSDFVMSRRPGRSGKGSPEAVELK